MSSWQNEYTHQSACVRICVWMDVYIKVVAARRWKYRTRCVTHVDTYVCNHILCVTHVNVCAKGGGSELREQSHNVCHTWWSLVRMGLRWPRAVRPRWLSRPHSSYACPLLLSSGQSGVQIFYFSPVGYFGVWMYTYIFLSWCLLSLDVCCCHFLFRVDNEGISCTVECWRDKRHDQQHHWYLFFMYISLSRCTNTQIGAYSALAQPIVLAFACECPSVFCLCVHVCMSCGTHASEVSNCTRTSAIYVYIYEYIFVYNCICIYTYMYIYIYIYIHTYVYA